MRHRSPLDELTDDPVTFLGALFVLSIVIPALLIMWRDQLVSWSLAHHLLVPTDQAIWSVPGTSAGLDLRRVVVLVFAVVAVVAAGIALHRRRRRLRPESRD